MTEIQGKGLWIWRPEHLLKNYQTIEAAMEDAKSKGFSHIIPKIANGTYAYTPSTPEGAKLPELVSAARSSGLKVVPWTYSYSYSLAPEITAIQSAWAHYGGDGFIIDAEAEYKRVAARLFAKQITTALKASMGVPVGYSSYRFPSFHQEFPFAEFNSVADFTAPQVYWEQAHNPGDQLTRSLHEYEAMTSLPYYPVGSSYERGAWKATAADVNEFNMTARGLGLAAVSWWRWDTAIDIGVYDELASHDWPSSDDEESDPNDIAARLKDIAMGLFDMADELNEIAGEL